MTFIIFLIGALIGFFLHIVAIKISFKQRTIDNKIKVYDAIITSWVKMRNQIYSEDDVATPQKKWRELDKIYGHSQTYIGEAVLVSEDINLAQEINALNEKFYRQNWSNLSLEQKNQIMENLKIEALLLVEKMRNDIKESTALNWSDISHIFNKLFKFS